MGEETQRRVVGCARALGAKAPGDVGPSDLGQVVLPSLLAATLPGTRADVHVSNPREFLFVWLYLPAFPAIKTEDEFNID